MADITSLVVKQKTIKSHFDKIFDFVAKNANEATFEALERRKRRLVELWHQWECNYIELEVAQPGEYSEEYFNYSDKYLDVMSELDAITNMDSLSSSRPLDCKPNLIDVKLPDILLPQFNGSYSQWSEFIDLYNSLIHNNNKLSPVQKLHYLKGALVDSASKLISSLSLTNENYNIAYELLHKTYNNTFLILNSHLQHIDNIPQIQKGTHESLSNFLCTARQQVHALSAAYEPAKQWDLVLLYILNKKVDNNTRMAWNLSRNNNTLPSITEFFNFLEQRVIALDNSFKLEQKSNPKAVHINAVKAVPSCACCKGVHALFKCAKFKLLEVGSRKELVKRLSLCFRCLLSGHEAKKCNFKGVCYKCKDPHNTLLHEDSTSSSDISQPNSGNNVLLAGQSNISTLLSTVSLLVFDANGKTHGVRALLDSGSQVNLITTSLARRLQCRPTDSVIKMNMLQGQSCTSHHASKIKIKSRVSEYQRTIHCAVVDKITQNLPSSPIVYNNWKIPADVELADPEFNLPLSVELLIGAELYFDVLKQGCIRLGHCLPILRKSTFGWIISGIYKMDSSSAYVGFVSNEDLRREGGFGLHKWASNCRELTPAMLWRHVPSKENPADIVSRGVESPVELFDCDLWWYGPSWLSENPNKWPNKYSVPEVEAIPEKRVLLATGDGDGSEVFQNMYLRYSKFNRLVRVMSYCLRWYNKRKQPQIVGTKQTLSTLELRYAAIVIFRLVQWEVFGRSVDNRTDKLNNSLKPLNPFLDSNNLLRVGGRLENANISFEQKHPIILPKGHHVVEIFLRSEHERLLHAGTQTVLANVRLTYWPIGARNMIKHIINKCMKCVRFKAAAAEQLMGNLPKDRVMQQRPFQAVGVDFAGPVILRASRLRKAPRVKAYIALFVCMGTKAVHIDLVTDLSTKAFLDTLRRFISRRGCCSIIHSDNGRNFVGANKELHDLYRLFKDNVVRSDLIEATAQMGIRWQFIPSYSPHFGGLWEGSIKCMKHHIRRVIGSHCLTYEEYLTVLTQIEAVLNSRPLLATTDDITDVDYISPGHFLIGEPLTALPEPYSLNNVNNLSKIYKQMASMRDQFWSTWSKVYLNNLQRRNKWYKTQPNLKVNDLVLLKEDNVPPLQWPTGRIVECRVGNDNKVRVVVVRTNTGQYTKSIVKVVPLPLE